MDDVVGSTYRVAAVNQYKFLLICGKNGLHHRLAEAAEIDVRKTIGKFKVVSHIVQQRPFLMKPAEQL